MFMLYFESNQDRQVNFPFTLSCVVYRGAAPLDITKPTRCVSTVVPRRVSGKRYQRIPAAGQSDCDGCQERPQDFG